jgi:hypothetical protein
MQGKAKNNNRSRKAAAPRPPPPRPKRQRKRNRPQPAGPNAVRRPNRQPKAQTMCHFQATERISQITVPTNVTPGTLLFNTPANPTISPRLAAAASQFDSWHGDMTLEVETTGNSFSQDYVILRHVPNGDPARLPTNARNLLNLAETCERPTESYKLQLDSNKVGRVIASWKSTYNPRKPILDVDPSECNNGLFIIVADGSPGASAVNLTIRLKYNIHFYGPVAVPMAINTTQQITASGGTISSSNLLGSAPVSTGPGSATAAANVLTLPNAGKYILTYYATGTGLGIPSAAFSAAAAVDSPVFTNVSSGTVAMATWNVTTTASATITLTMAATTVTLSYAQLNPNVVNY